VGRRDGRLLGCRGRHGRVDAKWNGSGQLCINRGQGDCLSANGTAGDSVYAKTWATDGQETLSRQVASSVCNDGQVTTTCPFTEGSQLNNKFAGDPIVYLGFDTGTVGQQLYRIGLCEISFHN
jgi:hypothetical protein